MTMTRPDAIKPERRLLNDLMRRYPACFKGPLDAPVPLKIGIYYDLVRLLPGVPRRHIAKAMLLYTRRPTYMKSLQAGSKRIDLAGRPCGEVTEPEADNARQRIDEYLKNRKLT